MNTFALRQQLKADINHTIHVTLPPEMGNDVEVIILPAQSINAGMPAGALEMAKTMDDSGFARNILNSVEEDCWNEL